MGIPAEPLSRAVAWVVGADPVADKPAMARGLHGSGYDATGDRLSDRSRARLFTVAATDLFAARTRIGRLGVLHSSLKLLLRLLIPMAWTGRNAPSHLSGCVRRGFHPGLRR